MTQSVLLTDSTAEEVLAAVASLEAWRVDARTPRALAEAIEHVSGLRAVLVTSDHGMSDSGGHGSADPNCRRTPFVLWGAGVKKSGPYEIEQIDLAPTLSALLGVPP